MAIKKFSTSMTSSMYNFYKFLIDNAEGTFLENMTITITSNNTKLDITDDTVTISIQTKETYNTLYLSYSGGSYNLNVFIPYANAGTTYLRLSEGALLCKNGLIFRMYLSHSYSSGMNGTISNVITVDSNGSLALVAGAKMDENGRGRFEVGWAMRMYYTSSDYKKMYPATLVAKDSTNAVCVSSFGFDNTHTSLAPLQPATADNSIRTPYLYLATVTQQSDYGLAAVKIGNDDYITDGSIYIQDE